MTKPERTILLAGGAGALGRDLVCSLSSGISTLIVLDNDEEALTALARKFPEIVHYVCDLTSCEDVADTIDRIYADGHNIDVLINNAGSTYSEPLINPLKQLDPKRDLHGWEWTIRRNLHSAFYITVCVVERMVARGAGGALINVNSAAASGIAGQSACCATRAAINALTASWSKELGRRGIRVVSIAPRIADASSRRQRPVLMSLNSGKSEARTGWERSDTDAALNGHPAAADPDFHGVQNSCLPGGHDLLAAIGLQDMFMVMTDDVIHVAPRPRTRRERQPLYKKESIGSSDRYQYRPVHRPWGTYRRINVGDRFQVKEITVSPGASLSLQYHHHRAEHWIVVEGTAEVVRDDETRKMHRDESIYIPVGATHRLTNPGKQPLRIIEVQLGSYLGEDDIVRLQDNYGRIEEEGKEPRVARAGNNG